MRPNNIKHTFNIGQNFIIPEPHYSEPLGIQPTGPFFIFFLFCRMLATVGFYDQLFVVADEIDDKPPDLFLPAKFEAIHLPGTQMLPEQTFSISGISAESSRCLGEVHITLPHPLP